MERLLADAEKLTGVHYDIDNLGDVYAAIHAIQGDLGLTGVAAAEASQTFSGSFNAMKASAQNLLGSLALGQNVGPAMTQLAQSVSTFFFGNFLPMIGTLVKSLPTAIAAFLQSGLPLLVSNVTSMLTNFASQITNFANGVSGQKITAWARYQLPKILVAGGQLVAQLATALVKNLPKIVLAIGKIGLAIVTGLGSALWGKVSQAAAGIRDRFMAPINALIGKVKAVIDKIKSYFPFSIGKVMSNIKLPHFSVSGKFGLNPPQTPKISVNWYAKGGIMDNPTLFGLAGGEAGPEAILPLNPFWDKMDKMMSMMQGGGDITINVYGTPNMSVNDLAEAVERRIIETQNRRRLAWQ